LASGRTKDCVYTYNGNVAANGTFATPGYPNSYPADTRCRFRFRGRPDQVVWIVWSDFHLEGPLPYQRCLHDYVEVIVIDRQNVQHISGRYCGSRKPPDFRTMQQSVDVIFQSSFSKHFQGFSGIYMFINEREVQPPISRYPGKSNPHSIGCGGFAQGTYGGVIKSPEYPQNYPADVECNWIIRVRSDKQIFIKILDLQLTPGFQCEDAQLDVFDGYAHYNPGEEGSLSQSQRVRFCGEEKYYREEGDKSYMSDRNRIHVRFKTTKAAPEQMKYKRQEFGSAIGFYLVWTEVSIDSNCASFYCRGGEYCIDEGKSICAERKRYCIDNSLVCDGIPNCAEFDNSDEENCYSKELMVSGICVLVLLVLVILTVVHWQRWRSRKQLDALVRGSGSSSSRHPFEGDFVCDQNETWKGADPLSNSLEAMTKAKHHKDAAPNELTTGRKSSDAVFTWEIQNHVKPAEKIPAVTYSARRQSVTVPLSDIMSSLHTTSNINIPTSRSWSTGYEEGNVWQQRKEEPIERINSSMQPLVSTLSHGSRASTSGERPITQTTSNGQSFATAEVEPVTDIKELPTVSPSERQKSVTPAEVGKEHKLPKRILKTSQASTTSGESAEMRQPTSSPSTDERLDSDGLRPDVAFPCIDLNGKSSKRKPAKQKVEFSDIVTVRIRPSDNSDEEDNSAANGISVLEANASYSNAVMKPTVV
ncbi:CUB domain protein, partial [Trichuris suis]